MLSETLHEFERVYNKLWAEIRDESERDNLISQGFDSEISVILIDLIKRRIFQLNAFEIMLHLEPNQALDTLKSWYLSLDLSHHVKDQVSDLEVMLSDIKDILGEEKLREALSCSEFLPENRNNQRVKDAIAFALDED
ncbi:TPA: hypothetical protein ACSTJE_001146 [Serratia fonticola]|uniref:hypothetical protein n=1 Tax=Serratia fonticola TaxID=47917 RepID=UPI002177E6FD|nr:hypothetical protein [Serratia fonticola]CAI0708807.1 Uncharacterised protein [Serratia fonticola]